MSSARRTTKRYTRLTFLLVAASMVGCGNQGDLYLPEQRLEELRQERRDDATPAPSPAQPPVQAPVQPSGQPPA